MCSSDLYLYYQNASVFFFFVQIRAFVVFNLAGISKFIYEGKNEMDSVRSSKMTLSCKWPIPLSAIFKFAGSLANVSSPIAIYEAVSILQCYSYHDNVL